MLSALIYLYDSSGSVSGTNNMGLLFQRLVRALWSREQHRRTLLTQSFEGLENALARLALAQINEGTPVSVPMAYAQEKVGSEQLVRDAVNASYITVNGGEVAFYHQLMQEYFAADAILHEPPKVIVGRISKPQYFGTIEARVASRWDAPLVALCGIYDRFEELIDEIAVVDVELAAACLLAREDPDPLKALGVAAGNLSPRPTVHTVSRARSRLVALLVRELQHEQGFRRFVAARTLRQLPDPAAIPALTVALQDHWGNPYYDVVSDYAMDALRIIGAPDALKAAKEAPSW